MVAVLGEQHAWASGHGGFEAKLAGKSELAPTRRGWIAKRVAEVLGASSPKRPR
jgi:hypothetical protein